MFADQAVWLFMGHPGRFLPCWRVTLRVQMLVVGDQNRRRRVMVMLMLMRVLHWVMVYLRD